jgi:hypothetical protein
MVAFRQGGRQIHGFGLNGFLLNGLALNGFWWSRYSVGRGRRRPKRVARGVVLGIDLSQRPR